MFKAAGAPLPDAFHVSVGFGKGSYAESSIIIGQCWARVCSPDDGLNHIFIGPMVDDPARVLDILIHELIHAWDDCQNGHSGPFKDVALELGLTGHMTATVASTELAAKLATMAGKLGAYPHRKLDTDPYGKRVPGTPLPRDPDGKPIPRIRSGPGPQGTRMRKVQCPVTDHANERLNGFLGRFTKNWLDLGMPRCPEGHEMVDMT